MAYQGRQPGVGVRNRFIYSATNGQTSFSGADSNGLTLAYADATYVDVFLNGTLLVPVTDYAATTKTSVVLGSGAAASDIVEIVAYDISSMSGAVNKTGDSMTGDLSFGDNDKAIFGAGSDLQIYHDGTHSYIAEGGSATGSLRIRGQNLLLEDNSGKDYLNAVVDAQVELSHNGSKKFETTSTGVTVTQSGTDVGLLVTGGSYNFQAKFESTDAEANIIIEDSNSTNNANMIGVATNDMYFVTNTAERLRITSSGQVGIGTSSPSSSYKVTIDNDESMIRMNHTGTGTNGNLDLAVNSTVATINANYSTTPIDLRFLAGAQERMRITSAGKMLVNTTTTLDAAPSAMLHVYNTLSVAGVFQTDNANTQVIGLWNKGNSGTRYLVWFESNASRSHVGHISTNGSSTSYVTSSDYRLKENVVDLTGASARVNQLDVKRFNFIADETNTLVDGFLAHEVATVVPEAITGTKDALEVWKDGEELPDGVSVGDNKLDDDGNTIPDYQGIDQSKLVPLLTAALQEALTEIASLKTRVEALEDV